jgi:hypothetical protein
MDYINLNKQIHKSYIKTYVSAISGPEAVKPMPKLLSQRGKRIPKRSNLSHALHDP